MTRRFSDKRQPVEPPPFVSRFLLFILAIAAFGMLAVYWHR